MSVTSWIGVRKSVLHTRFGGLMVLPMASWRPRLVALGSHGGSPRGWVSAAELTSSTQPVPRHAGVGLGMRLL